MNVSTQHSGQSRSSARGETPTLGEVSAEVGTIIESLIDNIDSVIKGKRHEVRMAVCCLLTEGHLLLDDVPGTGKTTLAKAIAGSIDGTWKRVQFTPDLLPSDITGVMVYEQPTGSFRFREGPVFTNVLIGDEINRGSPKTQSALLEVMEERQVTADGVSRHVPRPFFVIATQNPKDFQGTFPLPDVQLDRFTMRLSLGYTDHNTEVRLLEDFNRHQRDEVVTPVAQAAQLEKAIDAIDDIAVARGVHDYIVRIAAATRTHHDLRLGISTRGTIALLRTARAWAASAGREFVTPDDVQDVASAVCSHRIALTPEAELRGANTAKIVATLLDEVAVPRTREG
jgi:MoxR-like ATPase